MRPADNIEKLVKHLRYKAGGETRDRILGNVLQAMQESKQQKSTKTQPDLWRMIMKSRITKLAAAAIVGIAAMLPLAYGAAKIIKYFKVDGVNITVKNSEKINTQHDARNALEEFGMLYREGKARQVKPGVWVVTLSNGEEFAYAGDNPEWVGLSLEQKNSLLKAQNEELQKLREAGDFERTFIKEAEENGVKIRLYEDQFTLSSGKVVTMTFGEEQSPKEDAKNR